MGHKDGSGMSVSELQTTTIKNLNEINSAIEGTSSPLKTFFRFYEELINDFLELGRELGQENREIALGFFRASYILSKFLGEVETRQSYNVLMEQLHTAGKSGKLQGYNVDPHIHPKSMKRRISQSETGEELNEVKEMRKNARSQIPKNNPEYDHSLGINFLEASQQILETAERKASEKPVESRTLSEAARFTIGNVERTYDTDIRVYLKYLRG